MPLEVILNVGFVESNAEQGLKKRWNSAKI
jgi:hypothetical protein